MIRLGSTYRLSCVRCPTTAICLCAGTTHAKDAVFEAIRRGKSVVTANKALLAQYLPEIRSMLRERPEVRLGYEAAVCGGEGKILSKDTLKGYFRL